MPVSVAFDDGSPERFARMRSARLTGMDRKLMRYQEQLRQELPGLRAKFHVRTLGVFGSYVQGTAKKKSDLDLLVEFSRMPGLLAFIQCEPYLSDRGHAAFE